MDLNLGEVLASVAICSAFLAAALPFAIGWAVSQVKKVIEKELQELRLSQASERALTRHALSCAAECDELVHSLLGLQEVLVRRLDGLGESAIAAYMSERTAVREDFEKRVLMLHLLAEDSSKRRAYITHLTERFPDTEVLRLLRLLTSSGANVPPEIPSAIQAVEDRIEQLLREQRSSGEQAGRVW